MGKVSLEDVYEYNGKQQNAGFSSLEEKVDLGHCFISGRSVSSDLIEPTDKVSLSGMDATGTDFTLNYLANVNFTGTRLHRAIFCSAAHSTEDEYEEFGVSNLTYYKVDTRGAIIVNNVTNTDITQLDKNFQRKYAVLKCMPVGAVIEGTGFRGGENFFVLERRVRGKQSKEGE